MNQDLSQSNIRQTPPRTAAELGAARDELLAAIVAFLQADERFQAAWLTGSFGRDQADEFSDLDLNIVVADLPDTITLLERPDMVQGGTVPARQALVQRFGRPVLLHENHHNAPNNGTFTNCWYDDGVCIDWILIPAAGAQRARESVLLFDELNLPLEAAPTAESLAERQQLLTAEIAFFWMLAAATTKRILRGNAVGFQRMLAMCLASLREAERLAAGAAYGYRRTPPQPLYPTPPKQADALRTCCQKMLALIPAAQAIGATMPDNPLQVIDLLLTLEEEEIINN